MPAIYKQIIGVRDARGQHAVNVTYWLVPNGGTIAHAQALINNYIAAFEAVTNAAVVNEVGLVGAVLNPNVFGTNALYPNVEDKARLTFVMSNETLSGLSIPSPVGTGGNNIFFADGETVNLTSAGIVSLFAALTAVGAGAEAAVSKNGATYSALVAGLRRRSRFQRKVTIWTKDPTLSEPEE